MSAKKVLILSFEPISSVLSNGRTLKNLFYKYPKDSIYNIYVHGNPDFDFSSNFYCLSDKEALKSLFFIKPRVISPRKGDNTAYSNSSPFRRRSNFKLLVREYAWRSILIRHKFLKVARDINPDIIFVFLGNAGFMMKNAVELSKKLNIPLISYNCEDYYFKDYDYIGYKKNRGIIHRLYKRIFSKSMRYLINNSSNCGYFTDDLCNLFNKSFPNQKSYVIYNSSEFVNDNQKPLLVPKSKDFIYFGNISLGRLEELNKIGKAIQTIDKNFCLKIYSQENRSEFIESINKCQYIKFMGFIDYKHLLDEIGKAYALVHAESNDPLFSRFIEHSFSTKIPDCISSGNCFVCKVPKNSATYNYLKTNSCAHCFSSDSEIEECIKNVILNREYRNKYLVSAINVSRKNHSVTNNSLKLMKIIEEVTK